MEITYKEIIQKVVELLLNSQEGRGEIYFEENQDVFVIYMKITKVSKMISISGYLQGLKALAKRIGITTEELIRALEWLDEGKIPCAFVIDWSSRYQALIPLDESLWPNES